MHPERNGRRRAPVHRQARERRPEASARFGPKLNERRREGPASSCAWARAAVDFARPLGLPGDGNMAVCNTRLALKRGRLPQSGTLLNRAPTDELHKGPGCASVLPCCTSCSSARPRRRPPAGRRRCLCAELSGKTTTEASPVTDGAYFVWAPASRRKRWRRACLATKPKAIPLFCYLVRRL